MDFCFNCGATIPGGSDKCPKCGAGVWNNSKSKEKTGFPVGGLVLSVFLSVAIIIVTVILSKGYGAYRPEKAAEKYMKANYETFDAKRSETLWHKDILLAYVDGKDLTLSEYYEEVQDDFDDYKDRLDEYNAKITWKIVDIDDTKKSELEDIKEWYDNKHDLRVTDAKIVEVDVMYEDDEEDDEWTKEIYVVKIGGKWYIDGVY